MRIQSDQIEKYYDRIKPSSGEHQYEYYGTVETSPSLIRFKNRVEERHLQKILSLNPFQNVLDLGAGTGRWSVFFSSIATQLTLVEVSAELIRIGQKEMEKRKIAHATWQRSSIVNFRPTAQYDIIMLGGVLTYLNDEELGHVAAILQSCLAPNGTIILKEPIATGVEPVLHQWTNWLNDSEAIEYTAISRPEIQLLEPFSSFHVTYSEPTCTHLVPAFFGNTNHATSKVASNPVLRVLAKLYLRGLTLIDFWLRPVERWLQSHPSLRKLLVHDKVIQKMILLKHPPDRRSIDISVIILAFNEEDNIEPFHKEISKQLQKTPGNHEIIWVNDGSTDTTGEKLRWLCQEDPCATYVEHAKNLGMGAGLISGFHRAQKNWITWFPADGQIPAEALGALIEGARNGDFVVTKYIARPDHWLRKLMSNTLSTMILAWLGLNTFGGGNYMLRRTIWQNLGGNVHSMLLGVSLRFRYKQRGGKTTKVEIPCRTRRAGGSKVANALTILSTAKSLWRIRMQPWKTERKNG